MSHAHARGRGQRCIYIYALCSGRRDGLRGRCGTNIYHGSSLLAAILVDIVTTVYVGRKMAYRIHYVCALFGLPVLNIDSKKNHF